ncbi:39S ribosomal protein L32, mitochondrial [Orussus abietinus]|uniref:39S ribosomal protein L32, mitochondrial n=1 Tax=Orussus abietinus TaxID=222816 RepID=UPI0006257A14|nr:39S ribosomal protein L32, mitochondrial [Orussus abietinus]
MASNVLTRLSNVLRRLEQTIEVILWQRFPPGTLCAMDVHVNSGSSSVYNPNSISLKNIWDDGFLWAVPKSRRTIEKRLKRKFGHPIYNWKPLVPKTNLLMCNNCGHYHEAGLLCQHCYDVVKKETKEMQDEIEKNLGVNPIEEKVIVIYDGEKEGKPDDYWKGQRVVEMPKKRPSWFHQNLLQPATQETSENTEVKPTELA